MSPYIHSQSLNLYSAFYEVRRRLAEVSASYWVDLELYNWLNQAQQDIVVKSRCLEKEIDITTTEGTREYDLKTTTNSFKDIIDISEDGVNYDINGSSTNNQILEYKPIWQLNKEFPNWKTASNSIPQYYYYRKSSKTIGLYPEPNSSNAGAYMHVNGYYYPKILHAGTASSGSTTTLVMPAGSSTLQYPNTTNDYYNDLYVEIYSGTGAGQKLKITDYTASSRTLTFATATAPDSTSIYGMVFEIPESMHHLTVLYTLGRAWSKGGIRTQLGNNFMNQYYQELSLEIGDFNFDESENLIKDTYR